MLNLRINKFFLAMGLLCFVVSGSIYVNTPRENIDEECEICNYWDYCEPAVDGQTGCTNCDDNLIGCHLLGRECFPEPE